MNEPSCITEKRVAQPRHLDAQAYSGGDTIVEKDRGHSRLRGLHLGANTDVGHVAHQVQGNEVAQHSAETRQSALHSNLLLGSSVARGT